MAACLPSMHKGPGPNYPADRKKGWKSRREGKGKGQGREMKKREEIEMRKKILVAHAYGACI